MFHPQGGRDNNRQFTGGRGGRGGYQGRHPGRGRNQSYHANNNNGGGGGGGSHQEKEQTKLCKFFTLGTTQCKQGSKCSFSHGLQVMSDFSAHPKSAVKSMAVLPDGPQLITGGGDSTIKVWSLADGTPKMTTTITTPGAVHHIEINNGSTVLFSDDECLPDCLVPSGMIRILNQSNPMDMSSSIAIKRSEEFPYTHPQPINSFVVLSGPEGVPYVISSGLEGAIRMWRFSPATNGFEHVGVLEGHVRGITAMLLVDTNLWSASLDCTIRVWDLATTKCVGVLSASNSGHSAAVSCLIAIPPPASTSTPGMPPAPPAHTGYIGSGSMDGEVKLWSLTGEMLWSGSHVTDLTPGVGVTALHVFQDLHGGHQLLLIGLSDGKLMARSCVTMNLMFSIDVPNFGPHGIHMQTIWSIASLGHSCFVTADNTGRVIIWKAQMPFIDNSTN